MTERALISKIQRYSTKDGPGLRSTVFFMGCNLRCKWCSNPENLEDRPRVFYFRERCQKCGSCVARAENGSIRLTEAGCAIDRARCGNLPEMVDICPFDAYELIGRELGVDEVYEKLMRDADFYRTSGGGVSFSGGEAGLRPDFVCALAGRLRAAGVHVCLDTAGLLPETDFLRLMGSVDMLLYDIKAIDEELHRRLTGVPNRRILKNARLAAEAGMPMIVRLVIVPHYNDDPEDLRRRVDFICDLGGAVKQLDLLKYHALGAGKYEKLGEAYPIPESAADMAVDEEMLDALKRRAEARGLKVTVGG